MSGINGAKYKLMPESVDADLEKIKLEAKKIVEEFGGNNKEYEIEPVAFGLKAVIVFFFYPDNLETEGLENKFAQIDEVQSAQLIDMRKIA